MEILLSLIDSVFILLIFIFALGFIYYGGKYYFLTMILYEKSKNFLDDEMTQKKRFHTDKLLDNFMKAFIALEISMVIFFFYKLLLYKGPI